MIKAGQGHGLVNKFSNTIRVKSKIFALLNCAKTYKFDSLSVPVCEFSLFGTEFSLGLSYSQGHYYLGENNEKGLVVYWRRVLKRCSMIRLMGKKCGMVRLFDKDGAPIACTLLKMDPNVVTQIKTREKDGYEAVQLAFGEEIVKDPRTIEKRVSKPIIGHFKKAGVVPHRHLHETCVEDMSQYELGKKIDVSVFDGVEFVDVTGVSKGKGYQGVIKKYGFSGGPAAHGSGFHRHAGSTGMRTTPGRCLPGGPRPSHMGDVTVTTQNLKVILIDVEKGYLAVEGAVPGAKNGLVYVTRAQKKLKMKEKKK